MTLVVAKREPTAADRVGQVIGGRYKIQAVIGQGGFGAVYRAQHTATGDLVAIKVLRTDMQGAQDVATRFRQEAKRTSKLKHPNTVRVFDFGQMDDGNLFLAMEFLEGRTLADLLRRESPLPPERLVRVAVQVLKSLSEAHAKGLVHRDLKPDNIFLQVVHGEPDFVKVLDFGIAKSVSGDTGSDLTSTGALLGTPRYMSPEQARGDGVDLRTDLYSLGTILHEGLSGTPPFNAESPLSILLRRVHEEPPRVHDLLAVATPAGVCDAVLRAMARDPAARFASADEMAAALIAGLESEPLAVRPTPAAVDQGGDPATTFVPQGKTTGKVVVGPGADEADATLDATPSRLVKAEGAAAPPTPAATTPPVAPAPAAASQAGGDPYEAQTIARPAPALAATVTDGAPVTAATSADAAPALAATATVTPAAHAVAAPAELGSTGPAVVPGPPARSRRSSVVLVVAAGAVATVAALAMLAVGGGGGHAAADRPAAATTAAAAAPPPAVAAAPAAAIPATAAATATPTPSAVASTGALAPPAPVAIVKAKLKLILEPADATVEVDGVAVEGLEASLAPGPHQVRAAMQGFEPEAVELQVAAGEVHTLRLALKRAAPSKLAGKRQGGKATHSSAEAGPARPAGPAPETPKPAVKAESGKDGLIIQ